MPFPLNNEEEEKILISIYKPTAENLKNSLGILLEKGLIKHTNRSYLSSLLADPKAKFKSKSNNKQNIQNEISEAYVNILKDFLQDKETTRFDLITKLSKTLSIMNLNEDEMINLKKDINTYNEKKIKLMSPGFKYVTGNSKESPHSFPGVGSLVEGGIENRKLADEYEKYSKATIVPNMNTMSMIVSMIYMDTRYSFFRKQSNNIPLKNLQDFIPDSVKASFQNLFNHDKELVNEHATEIAAFFIQSACLDIPDRETFFNFYNKDKDKDKEHDFIRVKEIFNKEVKSQVKELYDNYEKNNIEHLKNVVLPELQYMLNESKEKLKNDNTFGTCMEVAVYTQCIAVFPEAIKLIQKQEEATQRKNKL